MLEAAAPSVQWAAVSTWVEEIRVPPHQGVRPFLLTSPTWRLCLQSVVVVAIYKTDLPWVFVLLSLLATNNTATGSTSLHAALKTAKIVSQKLFLMTDKNIFFQQCIQLTQPGKFLEQQWQQAQEQLWLQEQVLWWHQSLGVKS